MGSGKTDYSSRGKFNQSLVLQLTVEGFLCGLQGTVELSTLLSALSSS